MRKLIEILFFGLGACAMSFVLGARGTELLTVAVGAMLFSVIEVYVFRKKQSE